MKNILFLGYGRERTKLIDVLEGHNCVVNHTEDPLGEEVVADHDLLISFGYRHILTRDFLAKCLRPVINLHISFLPFNRGAHPNFWAFYEGTQSGVSIHLIDEGIDTGPVLFQEKVEFGEEEVTFSQTNNRRKRQTQRTDPKYGPCNMTDGFHRVVTELLPFLNVQ